MSLLGLLNSGDLLAHTGTKREVADLLRVADDYLVATSLTANPPAVRFVAA